MKNLKRVFGILVGMLMVVSLFVSGCSDAKTEGDAKEVKEPVKVIELKYAGLYSPPIPYAKSFETWIKYIDEKTKGQVKVTPFWGGTLISGKEVKAELVAGAADIAHATIYSEKGYEIVSKLPLLLSNSPNAETSARVSLAILEKFPEFQQEFSDVVILGYTNAQEYVLMSTKPVRKLSDLKGLTISGGAEGQSMFTPYGASVIKMPPAEQYMALEKGTIDATFLPIETLKAFNFGEVTKYIIVDLKMATAAKPTQLMNKDSFNKLPADIQKIFMDSKDFLLQELLKDCAASNQLGIDFAKEKGGEFIKLPAEDVQKWQATQAEIAAKAAKDLDAVGKKGTEILAEVQRLIK